jgi:predicted anti-sigma-YlaC factor YlaD
MSECDVMRESMPLLLTESLDSVRREHTHQHIEHCPLCSDEWAAYQETWRTLDLLPEVEVPARVKERFLAQIDPQPKKDNVVPFHRRPALKWIAQAAAVVIVAGGSYFAGHRTQQQTAAAPIPMTQAKLESIQPYSIAESRVLPASLINPNIEGRPDIQNVTFDRASGGDDEIQLAFDITSHVTVTGHPMDKSMVRLTRYVLENEDQIGSSRSRAIDWVRQTYSRPGNFDPEITAALANVLRNDEHQGVRIKAAETLKTMEPTGQSTLNTREALIDALKSDPNPAVRIKAVEALAKLASSGAQLDAATLDTLRQKAFQTDENAYVRLKAAEALSTAKP